MAGKALFFNGIDATTGEYLLPPQTSAKVAALGLREKMPPALLRRLKRWVENYTADEQDKKNRKRILDVDPKDLGKTGWGVVFASNVGPRVEAALDDLLRHRKDQACYYGNSNHYQVFHHVAGESAEEFLRRQGANPNAAVDPDLGVPYYLLLVGDPEALPYSFQFELDVNYSAGRIHFDTVEEYRQYAENVVAAEERPRLPREVALFGVSNDNDPVTQRTARELIGPLAKDLLEPGTDWRLRELVGEAARREQLGRLLGGPETPALLFTASHGLGFPLDDERQRDRQGALLCQDWRGPGVEGGVRREHYFTAEDLASATRLRGLVAFLFACYSAGTPERDSYYDPQALGKPRQIAPAPFVSRLCQGLLTHPEGGALAVVGHIDRAWTTSFAGSERGEGTRNFRDCLRRLLAGHTVGWAMEYFNQAHANLATRLSNRWEDQHRLEDVNPDQFAELWMANNDARNFVVFGDPAVKLAVGQ